MTRGTSGRGSLKELAFYDQGSWYSRTSETIFDLGSTLFSGRLPNWGMTRGGVLFELPMPGHLTSGQGSSSLLPTPVEDNANNSAGRTSGQMQCLATTVVYGVKSASLLPTPTVQDGANAGGAAQFQRNSLPLNAAVTLLPTPAVNDMGRGKTVQDWDDWTARMKAKHGNGNGHGKSLDIEAQRLLPTPTASDSRDGQHVRQMTLDAMKRGASKGANLNHIFENEAVAAFHMDPTRQPSSDGNTPSDAPPPPQPNQPDAMGDPD